MAEQSSATQLPAYVPFSTFVGLLDRLEAGGVPNRINRDYWHSFIGGSVGAQLMSALKFLDLIEDNAEPKPELEALVPQSQRKQKLAEVLRARYVPIFREANPERATRASLERAFKDTYSVDGDTRRKAVSFFLKAAQYGDVPLSSYLAGSTRAVRTTTRRPKQRKELGTPAPNGKRHEAKPPHPSAGEGDAVTVDLGGGNSITLALRLNLVSLDSRKRARVFELVDRFKELEVELPGDGAPRHEATPQEVTS